jgi:nucleotide-binding universal stress UspA family protein
MKNWRRILFPTDLSPLSDEAISVVKAFVNGGAKIEILHVLEPMDVLTGMEGVIVRYYDPLNTAKRLRQAQRGLKKLAKKLGQRHCLCTVVKDSAPAEAISKEAKTWNADLICLSTHGRSAWSRLFFGSTAQRLLAHYDGFLLLLKPSHNKLA